MDRTRRRSEVTINSMTVPESMGPEIFDLARRCRIAAGSGTTVQEINGLLKQCRAASNLMNLVRKKGATAIPGLLG